VIKGTNDDDITVCGAGGIATGWLGYEQVMGTTLMPDDVDSIYTVNAQAPLLFGGHFVIVARLAQSQTIVKGDLLVAAANGMVSKAAAATVTTGSASASSVSGVTPTITGAVGIGGIPIARAYETVSTTGAESDIMVLSLI
jgi:hypothetical protein